MPARIPAPPVSAARARPCAGASMSASVIPARASAASSGAGQSNRPWLVGSRVSGTWRTVTASTTAASGRLSRKIHRQPIEPMIQPPRNGPTAPATPPRPDQVPMALGRSSAANVAWMIASEPGVSSAPPMPCSTLAAMSTPMSGARPHRAEARANQITPITKTLRRPSRSPSAPPSRISPARVRV